jgi:sugar lactone lactonase YvrE
MQIKTVLESNDILGESPVWDEIHQCLYWVDIRGQRIHQYFPGSGQHQHWAMPNMPGSIALTTQGKLLVALFKTLCEFDPHTGVLTELLPALDAEIPTRFNDGKCDPRGRFWVGTSHLQETDAVGSLYCYSAEQGFVEKDQGFTVANGLAWRSDQRYMYFIDSPARTIYRYAYDAATGNIQPREVFATIADDAGYPDGMAIDNQDCLWVAHWDGARISRFSPQGELLQEIAMPVQRPTSVCFAGEGLDTLYVTSAAKDAQTGSVFAITLPEGITGCAQARFA